jgi:hypothetical protein
MIFNKKNSVSKVIAKVSHVHINICLAEEYDSLFFTLMQILELSALDLLFMLFSDVVQSIFFMNEFFAAFVASYNWVVVYMPCMTN